MDIDEIRDTYKDQWVTYVYGCGCSSEELVSDVLLLEVEPGWGCTECDEPGINGSGYVEDIELTEACYP